MPATGTVPVENPAKEKAGKAIAEGSCDTCFFGLSQLCSLPQDEACPTFRPQLMDSGRRSIDAGASQDSLGTNKRG